MFLSEFILYIAIIGNLFLGLFTFLKNPNSSTNRLFFIFSLSITTYLGINHLALISPTDQDSFFWLKQVMSNALIINLSFFLLSTVFPKKKILVKFEHVLLYILLTSVLIILCQINFVFVSGKAFGKNSIPGIGMPFFLIHTIFFLGGGFFILLKKLKTYTAFEKMQIKFFFIGAIIMFSSLLITNLLFVLLLHTEAFVSLLPIYTLIFLGFISYAIVRHRFLDIGLVVARTVSFILLIFLFALFYGVLYALLSAFFTSTIIEIKTLAISTLLAVIMAFTFQPIQRQLEKVTTKFFYRQGYNSQELLYSLSRIMASKIILSDLVDAITQKLFEEMKIASGSFILTKNNTIIWSKDTHIKKSITEEEQKITHLIEKIVASVGENMLVFEELEESEEKKLMREYELEIILPLVLNSESIGAIFLGNKLSGDIYSSRDLELLKILAPEIAVAVKNAMSFDEITKFNVTLKEEVARETKQLKELTEQQKDQVDIMGHEVKTPLTVISQQLNLLLEMVLTEEKQKEWLKGKVHVEDAKRVVEGLKKMQVAELQEESIVTNMIEAARLDKLRFELNYSTFDLIELIKLAIKDSESRIEANKLKGRISLNSGLQKLEIEADQTRLKQCIDGLLTNTEKYGRDPQTGELDIKVSVKEENQVVRIAVRDHGMGIAPEDMEKLGKKFSRLNSHANGSKLSRPGGSGLGLYTYKGIIEKHHGQLLIESEGVGKGSTFTIKMPIKAQVLAK